MAQPIPLIARASGVELHAHASELTTLRLRLQVPAVPASSVVTLTYPVPGLLASDVLFAAKFNLPAAAPSNTKGLFILEQGTLAGQVALLVGNLLTTGTTAGTYEFWALLVRPGGGGPPRPTDFTTPLAPV